MARGHVVIGAGRTAGLPMNALKGARRDEPIVQRFPSHAEWILARLQRASAVSVERNRIVVDAYTSHG
jgi:hypothetical protein